MQNQTLSKPNGRLTFETVVPNLSSTRHVAAAAFYHCLGDRAFLSFSLSRIKRLFTVFPCLVLATKDLIHLEQMNPYEPFTIVIV